MMTQAKRRFDGLERFEYIMDDYTSHAFGRRFDLVVSSLSIHHLDDTEKMAFYKKVHDLLNDKGVFVNGDQFISRSAANEERIQKKWIEGIEKSGLGPFEKKQAYERMKIDRPATVENNIKWLEEAGFTDVELLYKYGPFGVICGSK